MHTFPVSAAPIPEALPVCAFAENIECLSVYSVTHQVLSNVLGLCWLTGGKSCSFSLHV